MASMALGGDVSEKNVKNCRCRVQATLESMESAGARETLGGHAGRRPRGQTTRRFRWKEGRASLGCLSQAAVSLAAFVCSYCAASALGPGAWVLCVLALGRADPLHCSPQPMPMPTSPPRSPPTSQPAPMHQQQVTSCVRSHRARQQTPRIRGPSLPSVVSRSIHPAIPPSL